MSSECEKCRENTLEFMKALQSISRILDSLSYECCSREYTLNEDEMGWVFYCRDLADKALRTYRDKDVK